MIGEGMNRWVGDLQRQSLSAKRKGQECEHRENARVGAMFHGSFSSGRERGNGFF
jgi:hypothetical protein